MRTKSAFVSDEIIEATIPESELWPEVTFRFRPLAYGQWLKIERAQFAADEDKLAEAIIDMLAHRLVSWNLPGDAVRSNVARLHGRLLDGIASMILYGVGGALKNSDGGCGSSEPTPASQAEAATTAGDSSSEPTDES